MTRCRSRYAICHRSSRPSKYLCIGVSVVRICGVVTTFRFVDKYTQASRYIQDTMHAVLLNHFPFSCYICAAIAWKIIYIINYAISTHTTINKRAFIILVQAGCVVDVNNIISFYFKRLGFTFVQVCFSASVELVLSCEFSDAGNILSCTHRWAARIKNEECDARRERIDVLLLSTQTHNTPNRTEDAQNKLDRCVVFFFFSSCNNNNGATVAVGCIFNAFFGSFSTRSSSFFVLFAVRLVTMEIRNKKQPPKQFLGNFRSNFFIYYGLCFYDGHHATSSWL